MLSVLFNKTSHAIDPQNTCLGPSTSPPTSPDRPSSRSSSLKPTTWLRQVHAFRRFKNENESVLNIASSPTDRELGNVVHSVHRTATPRS